MALYEPKFKENYGMIVRSAYNFGANFIATIGHRYRRDFQDTIDGTNHIPLFNFPDLDSFLVSIDKRCILVGVEVNGKIGLESFSHPQNACYIFGGEDRNLPDELLQQTSVKIDTKYCLNLAVTAGIIMWDRRLKQTQRTQI